MEVSIMEDSSINWRTNAIRFGVDTFVIGNLPEISELSMALEDHRYPGAKPIYKLALSSSTNPKYLADARYYLSVVSKGDVFNTDGAFPEGIAVRGYGGLCVPYRFGNNRVESKLLIGLQCGHNILNLIGLLSTLKVYSESNPGYRFNLSHLKKDQTIAALAVILGL